MTLSLPSLPGYHVALRRAPGVLAALLLVLVLAAPVRAQTEALTEALKLTASDGAASDFFGYSVAVDGDVALVGATLDDDDGSASGSAYVFRFDGTTWTQEAKLTASDGAAGDWFGWSVAVDGDVALVGAYLDDDRGSGSGSAYVFRFDGTTWTQEAKLTASDGAAGDRFGYSVAVDGDVALVGAYRDDDDGSLSGSAYAFRFDGTTWTQEAKLTASDGAENDFFGLSVAVDGDVALVGAYLDDDDGSDSGSAYVFDLATCGAACTESAKLTASDGAAGDRFGFSVAVDGDVALVGAYLDDDDGSDSGSAYAFRFDGTTWTQEAKLTASDGAAGDWFGVSVAVDGDVALVGAYRDGDKGTDSGSAYAFRFDGTTWTQEAKLTASDGAAGDRFGRSVAVDGDVALVGAYLDDDKGFSSGSAYVFDLAPELVCTPGFFAPEGATSCLPAPAGSFVAEAGATAADLCQAGLFQPEEGQTSCLLAPIGTYVDVVGAASATSCPAGTTTPFKGAASAESCSAFAETEGIVAAVEALLPTGDDKADKDLEKALDALTESLDPEYWAEDGTPDPDRGKKVFDEQKKAAKELEKARDEALDAGNTAAAAAIQALIDRVVAADRALAVAAIEGVDCSAADDPKDADKCEKELEKALKELADGDGELAEAQADGKDYDKAIGDYKKAWEKAVKAAEKAAVAAAMVAGLSAGTEALPTEAALGAAFPNPSAGWVTVRYGVPESGPVRLAVYDALGREVAVLAEGTTGAGWHEASFDGSSLPTGVYLVRLTAGTGADVLRLTLVR